MSKGMIYMLQVTIHLYLCRPATMTLKMINLPAKKYGKPAVEFKIHSSGVRKEVYSYRYIYI